MLYNFNITFQLRHYQLYPFLCEGEPPPPISTPRGAYRPHKVATRCSEPTWNAHYSSTHHQCWYSFYLPTEGWRAESTPNQVELGVGIEPGTCCMMVCCSTKWAISAGLWQGNPIALRLRIGWKCRCSPLKMKEHHHLQHIHGRCQL